MPGVHPAGAAAALVGGGAGDPHRLEPRQAEIGLETRHAGEATVDNDAHPLDGQRRLGDGGRQHHLAAAGGGGLDGAVLFRPVERTEELDDVDGGVLHRRGEEIGGAADLGRAGQEDQRRSRLLGEGPPHHPRHFLLQPRGRIAADMVCHHGKGAPGALDHRCIREKLRHPRPVQRRRHDEDAQVLAQGALRVEGERQAEIGIEAALVELVEEHGGDAGQRWVVEDHAGEDSLGDHLDTGAGRDLGAEADPQADLAAEFLAERPRHAIGDRACRDAPRLENEDLPRPAPVTRPSAPAAHGWTCQRRAALPAPPAAMPRGRPSGPAGPRRWGARKGTRGAFTVPSPRPQAGQGELAQNPRPGLPLAMSPARADGCSGMGRRRARRDVDASRRSSPLRHGRRRDSRARRRRAAGGQSPMLLMAALIGTARGHRRGPFSCPATVGHSGCGLRSRGWFGYGPAAERV